MTLPTFLLRTLAIVMEGCTVVVSESQNLVIDCTL